jgi:hypothetical protein
MGIIGITLEETPKIGKHIQTTSVAAVVRGNSREEVLEEVKLDPYYVNGIWDPSKVRCGLGGLERGVGECYMVVDSDYPLYLRGKEPGGLSREVKRVLR